MHNTPVFQPGESQGRGVWWAAVYGVSQSRTRLKRLSSSSSSSNRGGRRINFHNSSFVVDVVQLLMSVYSVMSNSLKPHGLQPAGLLYSRDFPGMDTGVGCHVLLQGIFLTQGSNPCLLCLLHWQVGSLQLSPPYHLFSCSVVSSSLQPHGLQPARLLCLWDFPGKNTGVGCHFLLQGFFPTQESNLCLLHWQGLTCGSFSAKPPGEPPLPCHT